MKILIVADYPVPSIHKNYRADPLAKFLSSFGHEVTVLGPYPEDQTETIVTEDYNNVTFINCSRYKPIKHWSDLVSRLTQFASLSGKLTDLLDKEHFDVIRAVSFMPSYISCTLAKKKRIPLVTNLSDFYSDLYSHSRLPLSYVVSKIIRRMERRIVKESDVFIVDTPSQRNLWRKWGLNVEKSVVLPEGVDLRRFNHSDLTAPYIKNKYSIDEHAKIVYYHGDISHQDGVDVLLDSIPLTVRINPNLHFIIVGTGTERYMSYLFKKIKKYGINDYVTFTGWIPHQQIVTHLAAADVCVAPIREALTSSTSFSNKVKEYIAAHKPVVVSAVPGVMEMLGDIVTYARPEDAQDLAHALINTLSKGVSSKEKLESFIKKLNWTEIARKEETILMQLLNNGVGDFRKFDLQL